MKGSAELEVIIVIKDGGDRFSVQMQMLSWFPVIDVFPVPMQWCVEFFLKSERPAGSSLLFLNPFPRWDEKCNTFQLTLDFLQKYFWERILHVEHMKTVRGWERARFWKHTNGQPLCWGAFPQRAERHGRQEAWDELGPETLKSGHRRRQENNNGCDEEDRQALSFHVGKHEFWSLTDGVQLLTFLLAGCDVWAS